MELIYLFGRLKCSCSNIEWSYVVWPSYEGVTKYECRACGEWEMEMVGPQLLVDHPGEENRWTEMRIACELATKDMYGPKAD